MEPWDEKDMMTKLLERISSAEVIFHPDSPNTFAAYQIIITQPGGARDLWVNARNLDIIGGGSVYNCRGFFRDGPPERGDATKNS